MDELRLDFGQFYRGVWSDGRTRREAFSWQVRLASRVLDTGRWPAVIDLPTGAGKTSALDVAVYAMACAPHRFPRRVVFVVDRRVVVDQVVEHAGELARRLRESDDETVGAVRQRLIEMGGDAADLLAVEALRGGAAIGNDWARWPDQPCVLSSTVDQFGSRLLFRGYGVSQSMWPVHAGLAGNDCLVLLDEVHLAAPFAQTLRAIERSATASDALPRRWQVVEMSATPSDGAHSDVFALDPEVDVDPFASPVLARRLRARKQARLVPVGKKSESAAAVLAREVPKLVAGIDGAVTGVVVNRVVSARAIASALIAGGVDTILLTGRMRPYERDEVVARVLGAADPDRVASDERLVVVATQCIEVGADISFDALVTEAAPIDALKQRFGRLDRRGHRAAEGRPAAAAIVGVASVVDAQRPDPVYGEVLAKTWRALVERFGEGAFDVGPMSGDLAGLAGLDTERPSAPLLLPSHRRAFVQTGPRPIVDPDPAPFLHGFQDLDTDVSVVWRADIADLDDGAVDDDLEESATASLELAPPQAAEAMPVPLTSLRKWLDGVSEIDVDLADVPFSPSEPQTAPVRSRRRVFRWRGVSDPESRFVWPRELRPGDIAVVPCAWGGVELANWSPSSSEPVRDIGNRCTSRRATRLHPGAVEDPSSPPPRPGDDADGDEMIRPWLLGHPADAVEGGRVTRYKGWDAAARRLRWFFAVAQRAVRVSELDGGDEANSFLGRLVELDEHLVGVGDLAAAIAINCGLPERFASDLRLSGELHDLGKADQRFQRWLHGSELSMARHRGVLAKSPMPTSRRHRTEAREWAGYPRGMRHELMSVAMVAHCDELRARAHDWDLVLHLVASHHGQCRPLATIVRDEHPVRVQHIAHGVELDASSSFGSPITGTDWVDRFWRLVDRYGWHGLAWLEAILRLADHRRSEREANQP